MVDLVKFINNLLFFKNMPKKSQIKLNEKRKQILDYLFYNCRFTTKQLSRALNIPQQTISYMIKWLEKNRYAERYDAILNWNNLPLIKCLYLFNIKDLDKTIKSMINQKPIFGIYEYIGTHNLAIWCFFKNEAQQENFEKIFLEKKSLIYEKINIVRNFYPNLNPFETKIKLNAPLISQKQLKKIKLDKKDILLIKYLSSGHARDSLLKISENTGLSYDVVRYRMNIIIKNGYFARFMAQIGKNPEGITTSPLLFKLKKIDELIIKKLENLNFIVLGAHSKNIIHLSIFSINHKDFINKLSILEKILREKVISTEILYYKQSHLANRFPLDFLIN